MTIVKKKYEKFGDYFSHENSIFIFCAEIWIMFSCFTTLLFLKMTYLILLKDGKLSLIIVSSTFIWVMIIGKCGIVVVQMVGQRIVVYFYNFFFGWWMPFHLMDIFVVWLECKYINLQCKSEGEPMSVLLLFLSNHIYSTVAKQVDPFNNLLYCYLI